MPDLAVPPIEGLGIDAIDVAHEQGEVGLPGIKHEVVVVSYQAVGEHLCIEPRQRLPDDAGGVMPAGSVPAGSGLANCMTVLIQSAGKCRGLSRALHQTGYRMSQRVGREPFGASPLVPLGEQFGWCKAVDTADVGDEPPGTCKRGFLAMVHIT